MKSKSNPDNSKIVVRGYEYLLGSRDIQVMTLVQLKTSQVMTSAVGLY